MERISTKISALGENTLDAIDLFLEEYYEGGQTKEAGERMARDGMKTTQVRGLENLIVSTTRFSEIINYIKNQVGRRKEWKSGGPLLLAQLETIEQKAREIAGEDSGARLQAKLRLAKGWARQVVAHYLYKLEVKGGQP